MTTPAAPAATPFRVPLGAPPAGHAGPPAPGSPAAGKPASSVSKVLSTPRGQLGAAAVAVAAFALYRRLKANKGADPNAAASTAGTAAASPQGTADTSQTDLYNSLEPLIEQLAGYNLGPQLANLQTSVNDLSKTAGTSSSSSSTTTSGASTTTAPSAAGVPAGWITQLVAVGRVGSGTNIADEIKALRPGISAKDLTAAEYATIINPANRALGLGRSPIIPGGDRVTFVLPKAPAGSPGPFRDVATLPKTPVINKGTS
jgi:hypothetical protein